ncbi:hypothetical protein M5K25_025412 [Dendrobium thyrsiflorum]|uniref:Maturase K n=1 Tax=Dendrobium thyrsiflorum TaxID=117978 RepID=A0ABD0U9D8_DENTH
MEEISPFGHLKRIVRGMMMNPIKIIWFRRPGSSWSLGPLSQRRQSTQLDRRIFVGNHGLLHPKADCRALTSLLRWLQTFAFVLVFSQQFHKLISLHYTYLKSEISCFPYFLHWMADPEQDHGFVYDDQGQVDILNSPFFDINPEVDPTVEEYVDRIVFTLTAAIDDQLSSVQFDNFRCLFQRLKRSKNFKIFKECRVLHEFFIVVVRLRSLDDVPFLLERKLRHFLIGSNNESSLAVKFHLIRSNQEESTSDLGNGRNRRLESGGKPGFFRLESRCHGGYSSKATNSSRHWLSCREQARVSRKTIG